MSSILAKSRADRPRRSNLVQSSSLGEGTLYYDTATSQVLFAPAPGRYTAEELRAMADAVDGGRPQQATTLPRSEPNLLLARVEALEAKVKQLMHHAMARDSF